jgi:hypothetical protein
MTATPQQPAPKPRQSRLSPELSEFLHVMDVLEARLAAAQQAQH